MDDEVPRGHADGHPTTPPIVVILGGGIGAGKSAVGELLADRGFAVLVMVGDHAALDAAFAFLEGQPPLEALE